MLASSLIHCDISSSNKYTRNLVYPSVSFQFSHMAVPQIFPVLHLLGREQNSVSCSLVVEWGHMTMMHLWVEAMCHFWVRVLVVGVRLSRACFPSVGGLATFEIETALSFWVLEGGLCTQYLQIGVSNQEEKWTSSPFYRWLQQ